MQSLPNPANHYLTRSYEVLGRIATEFRKIFRENCPALWAVLQRNSARMEEAGENPRAWRRRSHLLPWVFNPELDAATICVAWPNPESVWPAPHRETAVPLGKGGGVFRSGPRAPFGPRRRPRPAPRGP